MLLVRFRRILETFPNMKQKSPPFESAYAAPLRPRFGKGKKSEKGHRTHRTYSFKTNAL